MRKESYSERIQRSENKEEFLTALLEGMNHYNRLIQEAVNGSPKIDTPLILAAVEVYLRMVKQKASETELTLAKKLTSSFIAVDAAGLRKE